jgi:hypothetical protein
MWLILLGISITALVQAVKQHKELEQFMKNKQRDSF